MDAAKYDVVGIGNAIVDVLAQADDDFLQSRELSKGAMTLIDSESAAKLYDEMGSAIECSGGSAANTIAGLASLGGRGAFVGKVCDDQLGKIFQHDIRALGVGFDTTLAAGGTPTAQCLIFVTPDAQRTMLTYLGACAELGPEDIDADVIKDSKIAYLEGYLFDPPQAKEAFIKASEIAHKSGRLVSLSLSDAFCVGRYRDEFLDLVKNHVDILFANEDEITSLYETKTFDEALQHVRKDCDIAALTRGEKGSVIVSGDEIHVLDAEPVENLSDTTGAGDSFAAGFLFGFTQNMPLDKCGRIGGIVAAETIQHMGARPDLSFRDLVEKTLGHSLD
jgi:sugar/nucleoside kinase (ribokinase family)